MNFIRNLLALVGFVALIGVGAVYYKSQGLIAQVDQEKVKEYVELGKQIWAVKDEFDPGAEETYVGLAKRLVETRNAAEATIWKRKVENEQTPEDVEMTMKFVANEHNISNVGELPLYKDVEAKTGEPYRFAKIYMFCNSLTAAMMMDYSDAYSAYLPCRITMIEDKQGDLWLYALDMDLMIHGGEPLPAELKDEAIQVKEIILDIMDRAASGDF